MSTLTADILRVLEQAKAEIQANMSSNGINASGRTSRGFKVEQYDGGMRLILAHDEFGSAPLSPKYTGSIQVGSAPLNTVEIGRPAGKVPMGFYYILKQWTRDKGLSFGSESERQTFAYFLANKIAREGTARNTNPVQVYSVPVAKAQEELKNDIRTAVSLAVFGAVKTNF